MSPPRSPLHALQRHAYDRAIPLNATFEITLGCNLRCVHCYNFDRARPAPRPKAGPALAPAEIHRIIEELAAAGTGFLGFTGGEALLHPRLPDFVAHAARLGLVVRLKTNATLLTPARAKAFARAGARFADVSVYGASASTHDAFTARPGSFGRTIAGIRVAREAGVEPSLSYVLHRGAVTEIDAMIDLARELGAAYAFSTELTARYDGTRGPHDQRVTPEQFERLLQGPHRAIFDARNDEGEVRCACARSVVGIASNGDVYPCIGAPIPSGNLRARAFAEIWERSDELNRIRGLGIEDFRACAPCRFRRHCTRSSGAAYVDTGDYTGPDPGACGEAEARWNLAQRESGGSGTGKQADGQAGPGAGN